MKFSSLIKTLVLTSFLLFTGCNSEDDASQESTLRSSPFDFSGKTFFVYDFGVEITSSISSTTSTPAAPEASSFRYAQEVTITLLSIFDSTPSFSELTFSFSKDMSTLEVFGDEEVIATSTVSLGEDRYSNTILKLIDTDLHFIQKVGSAYLLRRGQYPVILSPVKIDDYGKNIIEEYRKTQELSASKLSENPWYRVEISGRSSIASCALLEFDVDGSVQSSPLVDTHDIIDYTSYKIEEGHLVLDSQEYNAPKI